MSAAADRKAGARGLLAGEPVDRRTLLRAGSGALLALGVPTVLAACGRTVPALVDRADYQVMPIVWDGAPPAGDTVRLLTERAHALGMNPVLNSVGQDGVAAALRNVTKPGLYDPRTNSTPAIARLVVVGALEAARLEPPAARAIERGVKIVPFPLPLRHQTAAIVFDVAGAAQLLAHRAAAWARERLGGGGGVLLVLPLPGGSATNPFSGEAARIEQVWRTTLAREAPGLEIASRREIDANRALSAGEGAAYVAPAVRSHPGTRIVLSWSDAPAVGAARALREQPPAAVPPGDLFVGALGAPTVGSRATFAELRREGPLRLVIAARLRELADAMVDLPHTLLREGPERDVELAPWMLTPNSQALAAYSRDYLAHPPEAHNHYSGTVPLNPSAALAERERLRERE